MSWIVGGSVIKAMTRISPAEMGAQARIQPPHDKTARRSTTKMNGRLPNDDGQLCARSIDCNGSQAVADDRLLTATSRHAANCPAADAG